MKNLLTIIFLLLFSQAIFANDSQIFDQETKSFIKTYKQFINNTDFNPATSCLDEIQKRKVEIIGGNFAAPLMGIGGSYVLATISMKIFQFAYQDPWAGLGGFVIGGMAGVAGYLGLQGYKVAQLINTSRLQRIIMQAHIGYGPALKTFTKRVLRWKNLDYSQNHQDQIAAIIRDLDQSQSLCNSSLKSPRRQRKFERNGKLKHGVATKKDLFNFLITHPL